MEGEKGGRGRKSSSVSYVSSGAATDEYFHYQLIS